MSGDNIAFIYPDFKTAFVGVFENGVMISAKAASVEDIEIVDGIAEPTLITFASTPVSFCRSTKESVGNEPLTRDPYESRTVEVALK